MPRLSFTTLLHALPRPSLRFPIFRRDASTSTLPPPPRSFHSDSSLPSSTDPISAPAEPALKGKGPRPPGPRRTPPKNRQKPQLPPLVEADLEETFVRGSGPGGQSINKTSISCSLIHRPSGIRVQCHETRSRELNRLKARRIMQGKLDMLWNPGTSLQEKKWERERGKKEAKRRKGRRGKEASEVEQSSEDGEDPASSVP